MHLWSFSNAPPTGVYLTPPLAPLHVCIIQPNIYCTSVAGENNDEVRESPRVYVYLYVYTANRIVTFMIDNPVTATETFPLSTTFPFVLFLIHVTRKTLPQVREIKWFFFFNLFFVKLLLYYYNAILCHRRSVFTIAYRVKTNRVYNNMLYTKLLDK